MLRPMLHVLLAGLLTLAVLAACWRKTLLVNMPATPPMTKEQLRYGPKVSGDALAAFADRLPSDVTAGSTLADAVDVLREKTRQNIFVNWKALEAEGIARDVAVSQQIGGLPVGEAIERVLAEAGRGRVELGFTYDERVITLSTKEDLSGNTLTLVYDLRDSLPPPGDPTRQTAVTALSSDICRQIAPGTWRDQGGHVGAIRELSGQFIVTQTELAQNDLRRFLERMRWRHDLRIHAGKAAPFLLLAMGVVALLHLIGWWNRRARFGPGRCLKCGYDLRATPDRCPECGTMLKGVPVTLAAGTS